MVDSWELWTKDFKPLATRPFGNKPVWVGYDPAESGDSAGLVVVAPLSLVTTNSVYLNTTNSKGWISLVRLPL